jgi:UDP-N-acetylglucosamine 2-epimerase
MATDDFFRARGIERDNYYVMTCHRRENVHMSGSLLAILNLTAAAPRPVYFPASYRTQKVVRQMGLTVPPNVIMVDPVGYEEILCLMVNSRGVITDSGTVVEETCVLQIPSLQMRKSTERPQVYDVGSSVKFDPAEPESYPADVVYRKLEALYGKKWPHTLGDGKASLRIAEDLHRRIVEDDFAGHKPEQYHLPIARSYRDDGLDMHHAQK